MMKVKMSKKKQLLISACIIAVAAVGITYAFLSARSSENVNDFQGGTGKVNISVVEKKTDHEDYTNNEVKFDKISKDQNIVKQVQVKNLTTAEYPTIDTYVRVKLAPVFVKDGSTEENYVTYGESVKLEYTMKENTNWKYDEASETFYYTKVLKPGESSDVLLESVTLKNDVPKGYHLELQVLSDGIIGKNANNLQEAWGLTADANGDYFSNMSAITKTMMNYK